MDFVQGVDAKHAAAKLAPKHLLAAQDADLRDVTNAWSELTMPKAATAELFATLSPAAMGLAAPSFTDGLAGDFVLGGLVTNSYADGARAGIGPRTDHTTDLALRGDIARHRFDVTGAGVKIGILSDSFNLLGGMWHDEHHGNLPRGVRILQEGAAGGHDEGRAMADIIHSVAPGAQILFHTATAGEANMAEGIAALKAAGCTLIVDDVAYLNEPFFQDGGVVQAAVESAVAAGASYFTAASNEGQDFVQQAFQGMRVSLPTLQPGGLVQNFGGAGAARPWLDVTVPTGGVMRLDMQWDQPFASIGTGHASANSLGLALYDTSGRLVAAATNDQVGGDPNQIMSFTNITGGTQFRLVVFANGGATPPGMFKIINYGNGQLVGATGGGSGTVIGHEMVMGNNTVGAVDWSQTQRFGGAHTVESFSSVGSGNILFGADGQRLAQAISPAKVNFLAPDGSVTSVMAPFYGTSAAAPAAAAVAALMLQADPYLTPAQVTQILSQTAASADGPAAATGAGLIQADAAVSMAWQMVHGHL